MGNHKVLTRVSGFVHVLLQVTLATKLEDILEGAQTYAELWHQRREILKPKDS